jgi:ketosteroid isomerase-like protein
MRTLVLILTTVVAITATQNRVLAQTSPEIEQIKAANKSYYAALSALDMNAMEKVWSRGADNTNIAPPVRPVVSEGWDAIKKAYQGFWGTLDKLTVSMEEPSIRTHGPVAWVYGIEKSQRKLKNGQDQTGTNIGTSIFINQGGQWLMVFHQAAAVPQ